MDNHSRHMTRPKELLLEYHERSKHHVNRYAPGPRNLDWETQPNPFREFRDALQIELPIAADNLRTRYNNIRRGNLPPPHAFDLRNLATLFELSFGLSAWKTYGSSRWALRCNPSSGNLHPTEAWIVHDGRVCHYAPREHGLEERCLFESPAARTLKVRATDDDYFLVALTSIIWREAWKYGERAFRYCQHDVGHAIGSLRFAAALLGWRLSLLPEWSDAQIAALLGLDRDEDYDDAEREEPECVALVSASPGFGIRDSGLDPTALVAAVRAGGWSGRANRLSSERVEWPLIDEVAAATRYPGPATFEPQTREPRTPNPPIPDPRSAIPDSGSQYRARPIILQRRSALSFDARGVLERETFIRMLGRLQPFAPPWDAIYWPPHVHLVLFVHRVRDLTPGVYAYLREPALLDEWRAAMRAEFMWEAVTTSTGKPTSLFLLVPIDARRIANRLSCDQDIAEDGFFGLAMIARFAQPLRQHGDWFYRRLFWECGLIGQLLYLEAEAAGARSTGIGCYYDDPVHELLGLSGNEWQSLYHFSMGSPIEDTRLTTEAIGW